MIFLFLYLFSTTVQIDKSIFSFEIKLLPTKNNNQVIYRIENFKTILIEHQNNRSKNLNLLLRDRNIDKFFLLIFLILCSN